MSLSESVLTSDSLCPLRNPIKFNLVVVLLFYILVPLLKKPRFKKSHPLFNRLVQHVHKFYLGVFHAVRDFINP